MHGHLEDEKTSWLAFIACFIAYSMICMTKNTYSAAIAAIVSDGLFTKSNAGLINASFYLFYGISQFAGGYLADRISPFKIILIGLIGSIIINAVMALSSSFLVMLAAWSLNGIALFGIWPSVIKIISSIILKEHRQKASLYISTAYTFGITTSYLVAMGALKFWEWPSLFWTSVVVLLLTTAMFVFTMLRVRANLLPDDVPKVQADAENRTVQTPSAVPLGKILLSSGLLLLTIPGLIRCMLDIGLKSWVPTMIMESYGVSPSFSSLLTTVLLFLNLFGILLAVYVYPRRYKNVALVIGLFFLASFPLLLLLLMTGKIHLILVTLLLAVVTTFMTAASRLLDVVLPAAFAAYQKTGTVAGILNAFACFGCTLANYLYGYLAEHFGWTVTIWVWVALSVVAVLCCLAAAPLWKRFTAAQDKDKQQSAVI